MSAALPFGNEAHREDPRGSEGFTQEDYYRHQILWQS
jgi:hypothetical protein